MFLTPESLTNLRKLLGCEPQARKRYQQDLFIQTVYIEETPGYSRRFTKALNNVPSCLLPDEWLDTRPDYVKEHDPYYLEQGDGLCFDTGATFEDKTYVTIRLTPATRAYFLDVARILNVGYAGLSPAHRGPNKRVAITLEAIGQGWITPSKSIALPDLKSKPLALR